MADISALETALQNAHAAGDSNAATVLAGEITKLRSAPQKGLLEKAIEPITSYPQAYNEIRQDAQDQMSRAAGQIATAARGEDMMGYPVERGWEAAKGVTNAALGGLGYAFSPVNAALRTVVGKPIEENTGIPKEYTEFAASMLLPGSSAGRAAMVAKPAAATPSTGQLLSKAGEGFQEVRQMGGQFSPELTASLADHVSAALKAKGAYPHLASSVHETVNVLRKQGDTNLDEVRSVMEALSSLKADPDGKVRRAAGMASDEIGQFLARNEPRAAAALDEATANYAAGKRAQTLDRAGEIAGLRTGRAGYGGNAVNNMRQVLSPIVESAIKGNAEGFSPEEIRVMQEIVTGSGGTNFLRGVGQLSPSKGAIQTGIAIGTGGLSAGLGAAANKLAAVLTSKQIDQLSELVRKRSPAYEQTVSSAAARYFNAVEDFQKTPSPGAFAKALTTSRALSSGLVRDGISVSSADLIRAVQGPMRSGAENEQPEPIGVGNQ